MHALGHTRSHARTSTINSIGSISEGPGQDAAKLPLGADAETGAASASSGAEGNASDVDGRVGEGQDARGASGGARI